VKGKKEENISMKTRMKRALRFEAKIYEMAGTHQYGNGKVLKMVQGLLLFLCGWVYRSGDVKMNTRMRNELEYS